MKKITIYTDGACKGNPGPGGWGAIMLYNDHERELSGFEADTTNNRMEMKAVIEGLKALSEKCEVTIYTDSTYVMKGMQEWLPGWRARGWKTASKKPVKNKDLWIELDEQVNKHKTSWQWVKGHNGDPMNERADALAVAASIEAIAETL